MTIQEAINILQPQGNTEEDLKKAFREYALKYHPDRNADGLEMMKLGNIANELLMRTLGQWRVAAKPEPEPETMTIDQELLEMIQKVKGLIGVKRELRGVYLWLWGNTKEYRQYLKDWGFKWAPKKQEWWYAANGRKPSRHHREMSRDEIRERYGCQTVEEGAYNLA